MKSRPVKTGTIKYYFIGHDPKQPGAERSANVRLWVERFGLPSGLFTGDEAEANAYYVATGDGGLMRAVHDKASTDKLIFGHNCGTLGFLLNDIPDINRIPTDFSELEIIDLKLIKVTFRQRVTGVTKEYLAFNDVIVGGDIMSYPHFTIKGDLAHFPKREVSGTGLIISTAQGATAYALKAGLSSVITPLDTNDWVVCGVATGPYPRDHVRPQRIVIDIKSRTEIVGYADIRQQNLLDIDQAIIEPSHQHVEMGFLKGVDFEMRRRGLVSRVERGES